MISTAPTRIEPLTCRGCGAALPLPRSDEAGCSSCGATFRVPEGYRALRAEAEAARRARREAEERWRRLPGPLLPAWAAEASAGAVVALTAALTAASLIGWARYGLFTSVRDMVVLGMLTPLFVLVWGMIESLAARSHTRSVDALSALPPAGEERPPRCRVCGAPLDLEPDALAATCDYCQADSIVTRLSSRRRRRLEQAQQEAERRLGPALLALEAARDDHRLARVITIFVLASCWLGFWFGLPG